MQTSSSAPAVTPKVDKRAVIAHLLSCAVAARSSEASATPGATTMLTPSSRASSGGQVLPRQWIRPQVQGGAAATSQQVVSKPSGPQEKPKHPAGDAATVAPLLQGGFALSLSLATYRFPAAMCVAGEAAPEAVQRKPDPIRRGGGGVAALPSPKPRRHGSCGEDGDGASEDGEEGGGVSGEEGCRALGPCPPYHPSAYAESIQCNHVEHWKRLRAKRGYAYFVCHLCTAKWRLLLPYSKPKRSPPSSPLQPTSKSSAPAYTSAFAYPSQMPMAVPTPLSLLGGL